MKRVLALIVLACAAAACAPDPAPAPPNDQPPLVAWLDRLADGITP